MYRNKILLHNMLLSTSGWNVLKYEQDSKKRGRIIGGYIGMAVLLGMLFFYALLLSIGYGKMGLTQYIPVFCVLSIFAIEFVFTVLKSNAYLFAFREYDMLMALPFSVKTIVSCKFLYMYIRNLPWVASLSLPMMIGYGIYAGAPIGSYLAWILLSVFLPVIPMVFASAVGTIIAAIGSFFRHKQLMQTILTFVFVLFCFSIQYIVQYFFSNETVAQQTLRNMSKMTDRITNYFIPAKWFAKGICDCNIAAIGGFIVVSIVVYELFFCLVSKFYRQINSRLLAGNRGTRYQRHTLKRKNIRQTIALKEWKKLTNCTIYFTNIAIGVVLALVLAIAVFFVDVDKMIAVICKGAPIRKEMLVAGIPFIIYFLVGMCATTACSYSLEGKNYWIVQSLPIPRLTLIQGKMLFNLYFTIPVTVIANTSLCIACGVGLSDMILCNICGIILCAFSTVWGMRCNLKHPNMEWENEVEVVKQGASVTIYLLPNMFGCMAMVVLAVAMSMYLPVPMIWVAVTGIMAFVSWLLYRNVVTLCKMSV